MDNLESDDVGGAGHAILIENFDKDYNVTEEEMLEYAHEIGINCETESNLLWIAWEGVMAPLPDDWIAIEADDKVYYRNSTKGITTWEHPCDSHYKNLVLKERKRNLEKKEVATSITNNVESEQNHDTSGREEPQGAVSNTTLYETKTEKNLGATPKRNVHFVESESVSEYDEWKRSNRRLSSYSLTNGSKDSFDIMDASDLEKNSKGETSIGSFSAKEGSGAFSRGSIVSTGERLDVTVEKVFAESRNALRMQQTKEFKKYEEMLRNELKEKKERLLKELQDTIEKEQEEQQRILRFKMDEELKMFKFNLEEDKRAMREVLQKEHTASVAILQKELSEEREKIIKGNKNEIRAMLRVLKETNEELKRLLEDDAKQLKEEYKTHFRNLRREQREELDRLSKECAVLMKMETNKEDKQRNVQVGVGNETSVSGSLQNSAVEDVSSSAILNLRISKMEACLERYQKRIEKLESIAEDDVSTSLVNRTIKKGVRKKLSSEKTSDVSMISQRSRGAVDESTSNLRHTDVDSVVDNVFARIETMQHRPVYNTLVDSSKDDRSESTTTTSGSTTETGSSLESTSATDSISSWERFGSQSVPRFYGTATVFNNEVGHRNHAFYTRYEREGIAHYGERNSTMFSSTNYPYEKNDWKTYNVNPVMNTEEGLRRQKEWLRWHTQGGNWKGTKQPRPPT